MNNDHFPVIGIVCMSLASLFMLWAQAWGNLCLIMMFPLCKPCGKEIEP